MLKQNEGLVDRIIRVVVGLAVLISGYVAFTGIMQAIVYAVGLVMVVTGGIGFCALYELVHISTKK